MTEDFGGANRGLTGRAAINQNLASAFRPAFNHGMHPRRKWFLVLLLLTGLIFAWLIGSGTAGGRHAEFGNLYETAAYDLNEARANRLAVFLRTHLPQRILQARYFPERFKDQPRYLDLNGTPMEWSIGGDRAGWLYFWGITSDHGLLTGKWEFAPCAETRLEALTLAAIPSQFHGTTDPRLPELFGSGATTNAIKVQAGQILFARRTDESNRVYVLKLKEQTGNRLVVRYGVVEQK